MLTKTTRIQGRADLYDRRISPIDYWPKNLFLAGMDIDAKWDVFYLLSNDRDEYQAASLRYGDNTLPGRTVNVVEEVIP